MRYSLTFKAKRKEWRRSMRFDLLKLNEFRTPRILQNQQEVLQLLQNPRVYV